MPKEIKTPIGGKFNRWTILKDVYQKEKKYRKFVLCQCECGKRKIVNRYTIMSGKSSSCGCFLKEFLENINRSHGMTGTRFYRIWKGIIRRCGNKNDHAYSRYGGRGILCEWANFEEFQREMFDSYNQHCSLFGISNTTIDRINNNGNYCSKNCRWATYKVQANNH